MTNCGYSWFLGCQTLSHAIVSLTCMVGVWALQDAFPGPLLTVLQSHEGDGGRPSRGRKDISQRVST